MDLIKRLRSLMQSPALNRHERLVAEVFTNGASAEKVAEMITNLELIIEGRKK